MRDPHPNLRFYQEIRKRRILLVFINSYYPQLTIPHVSINDHMAGWKMTKYPISKEPGFDANYEFDAEVVKRASVRRIK